MHNLIADCMFEACVDEAMITCPDTTPYFVYVNGRSKSGKAVSRDGYIKRGGLAGLEQSMSLGHLTQRH